MLHACGGSARVSQLLDLGALRDPDANGLRLPEGFTSRIIARTGDMVASTGYVWHGAPDGGATFPVRGGGWIYVSNAELSNDEGGVGAILFGPDGAILDAYPILESTNRNCAGGPTPWGTWLSCEEYSTGAVFECDPLGNEASARLPRLGLFRHEAAIVDIPRRHVYLTEDETDGCLYRFVSNAENGGRLDLTDGTLEVMRLLPGGDGLEGPVEWVPVTDPEATSEPTRYQVMDAARFAGGEGIWKIGDIVYFTAKSLHRVWAVDIARDELTLVYNGVFARDGGALRGPDNAVGGTGGELVIAEDGGEMRIVVLDPNGDAPPVPIVQVADSDDSEITGPAFDPSGTRLYFSSQRGVDADTDDHGITYEVTGPFVV